MVMVNITHPVGHIETCYWHQCCCKNNWLIFASKTKYK